MIIHHGYENLNLSNPVVTMGIFDGVHRGHRFVIDHLTESARMSGGESVLITFDPHPRMVLSDNSSELRFLTGMEEKISLLKMTGVDHLVIVEFNDEFSKIDACSFIEKVLMGKIGTRHLITGFNHHFGRKGEGDFATIKKCAELFDFRVDRIEALQTGAGTVSSSNIRNALLAGDLEKANELLGYSYFMKGTIVMGKKIGRKLGFPTANIDPVYRNKLIPMDGVYAVELDFEGKTYKGMLSIGFNPTVNDIPGKRTIEAYIFDFNRDIYGSELTVRFRYRLRDEIKFENLSLLIAQLEADKIITLKLLG